MRSKVKLLIPLLIFILAIFIVGTGLTKPFWGIHDWNGARYGNIAKNYLRYSIPETKLGQVENGGMSTPKDFIYYTHYQPLLPLLIAGSYKILGVSEYATRIVPLAATAGFVVVLYFVGLELGTWQTGLFASLLTLATPMLRYYGKNPVHEPLALFFAALSFLGALIIKKGNQRGWTPLITGFILTALTNWSFVFLLPALSIFLFDKKSKKNIFLLWFLGAALTGLHFLYIKILTGSFLGGGLAGAFLERTSIDNAVVKFSVVDYILQIRLWFSTLFTNTLLVSAAAGVVMVLKNKSTMLKRFILSAFVYCLYPIFFANASFIHSYFIYYFAFPLALLGGYLCSKLIAYKKILLILVLGILVGVWFERNDYLKALNVSSGDKLAVEVAGVIKNKTQPDEVVLVEPQDYAYSRLPFLSYYSDRNIVYNRKADWVVKITGHSYNIIKENNVRRP